MLYQSNCVYADALSNCFTGPHYNILFHEFEKIWNDAILVTVKLTTGTDRGARVLDSMMPVVDDAPPITTVTEGNPANNSIPRTVEKVVYIGTQKP